MKLKSLDINTAERDKYLHKKNGEYFFFSVTGDETELLGMHCKAYILEGEFYFQFDSGHFMTNFVDVIISTDEFCLLRSGNISFDELYRRYSKSCGV